MPGPAVGHGEDEHTLPTGCGEHAARQLPGVALVLMDTTSIKGLAGAGCVRGDQQLWMPGPLLTQQRCWVDSGWGGAPPCLFVSLGKGHVRSPGSTQRPTGKADRAGPDLWDTGGTAETRRGSPPALPRLTTLSCSQVPWGLHMALDVLQVPECTELSLPQPSDPTFTAAPRAASEPSRAPVLSMEDEDRQVWGLTEGARSAGS